MSGNFSFLPDRARKKILSEARNNEGGEGRKKLNTEKQMGSDSPFSSCHISGLIISFFPVFLLCLPGAGGSGPEDGQNNQQEEIKSSSPKRYVFKKKERKKRKAVSGIYEHTVATVLHCPSVSEYRWRASKKCGEVCGTDMQNENCKYHCMRDSYKTSIVEFCAELKILFVYCPMYDPIGRTIQMDLSTLCHSSNSSQEYFMSSDVFFCDPDNCLRLRKEAVSTGVSMIETTTSSGGINDGWLLQYWYILVVIGFVVVLFVVVGCIFRLPKRLAAFFRKLMKKRNPDDKQAEVELMLV